MAMLTISETMGMHNPRILRNPTNPQIQINKFLQSTNIAKSRWARTTTRARGRPGTCTRWSSVLLAAIHLYLRWLCVCLCVFPYVCLCVCLYLGLGVCPCFCLCVCLAIVKPDKTWSLVCYIYSTPWMWCWSAQSLHNIDCPHSTVWTPQIQHPQYLLVKIKVIFANEHICNLSFTILASDT